MICYGIWFLSNSYHRHLRIALYADLFYFGNSIFLTFTPDTHIMLRIIVFNPVLNWQLDHFNQFQIYNKSLHFFQKSFARPSMPQQIAKWWLAITLLIALLHILVLMVSNTRSEIYIERACWTVHGAGIRQIVRVRSEDWRSHGFPSEFLWHAFLRFTKSVC